MKKIISIITPCYNESDNVRACRDEVASLFENKLKDYDYEHIFCDNKSTDDTPEILREMAAGDPRIKVILNARNFGPFRSTFNAILAATGDAIVPMLAVDLQDPPEIIEEFVKHWENGYQVVFGVRKKREEGLIMRKCRAFYYYLVNKFADVQIPQNVGEFQLIDKVVLEELKKFDDYYPYIRGMIASCGFNQTYVEYTWKARRAGFSKNRLFHLIDQALNGLISFTMVPLRLLMLFGFVIAFSSIVYAIAQLVINLFILRNSLVPGMPTLIVAIFFFAGVQLFFLGLIGEYIGAIHFQVRKRPLVIEQERINFNN